VYRETASGTWVKVRTVWPTQITITGLSTGRYEFQVVAVNIYASTGQAGYVTVPVR
jgi:predicted phage tail protein